MANTDHDEILRYYNEEVTYLRRMGRHFAQRHPKVAAQLELAPDGSADPSVERLIESFAFLTARIQKQLDSQFPEITSALLGVLYPHLVHPIPPMVIARFDADPDQGKLTDGFHLPTHTPLFAQSEEGLTCRFRTCYPVTVWPLEVLEASLLSPSHYRFLDGNPNVASILRVRLASIRTNLPDLSVNRLRFYLNGDSAIVHSLYTLLFENQPDVALLTPGTEIPRPLSPGAIQPIGFELDEEVIPYPPHAHPAYRLIQEYFLFPQKFFFFEIQGLHFDQVARTVDILILLKKPPVRRLIIDRQNFVLGCTPAINLFPKSTEPVRLDQKQLSYRLIADLRRERTTEIHSIQSVSASMNPKEETTRLAPFYGFHHRSNGNEHRSFWHMRRVPTGREDLPGTDVQLSFVDLDFNPRLPPQQTVFAHVLCTNRALAHELQAGTVLQIEERAPLAHISCQTKPTQTVYPPLSGATLWYLISNLSLNYLSLSNAQVSLKALREALQLYSFSQQASAYQQVQGIRGMHTRKVVRRAGKEAWRGFATGTEITLEFDEDYFAGSGPFLFGAVLNHFFGLYASINSFTQLIIRSKQREGEWKRWLPRQGSQQIL